MTNTDSVPNSDFVDALGPLFVINLPERPDRRRQFEEQLRKLNLDFGDPRVQIFKAVRPETEGGFTSVGARGCFLSHLGLLKTALSQRLEYIIVCEDDLNFVEELEERIPDTLTSLGDTPWDIFYGGHHGLPDNLEPDRLSSVVQIRPGLAIRATHFIVFRQTVFAPLIVHLEELLARPPGHPDGGPMHVDGAYSRFRAEHPEVVTLAALPPLGYQRASRTDIHTLRWFDRIPLIRDAATLARRVVSRYMISKR